VIAGRAAPGDRVSVRDGSREIGVAVADRRGEWVLIPDQALPPGARELSLSARGADGVERRSDQVVVLAVPEPGRDLAGRATERPVQPLAVLAARGGEGDSKVLQAPPPPVAAPPSMPASTAPAPSMPAATANAPPAASAGPAVGREVPRQVARVTPERAERAPAARVEAVAEPPSVDTVDYDETGRVRIGGTGRPGSRVAVYLGDRLLGHAEVDAAGAWRLVPEDPIAPGLYELRVDQLDQAGRVVSRVALPFERAAPERLAENPGSVVVQPGNSLWRIARRIYGRGIQYTVIYSANQDQIRNPHLIYPGQVFAVPDPEAARPPSR